MIQFLIKSFLILVVLYGVYRLLLSREKMYQFNRFYLLGALAVSFVLPLISIPYYVTETVTTKTLVTTQLQPQPVALLQQTTIAPKPVAETTLMSAYLPYIVWGIYGAVTLLLMVRFARNVRQFYTKVKCNEKVKLKSATVVLLDDCPLPYTFMQYIFVSKNEYNGSFIEEELLTHELAHVRQRHTLDVLFTEVLKTVFWFNPLLYLYKKAIQTNHEFLADEAVVQEFKNITTYQLLLLDKINPPLAYALASSINFNLTKKRFTMMTKTTTKTKGLLLKLAVLPVIAVVTCAFSFQRVDRNIKPEKDRNNIAAIDTLTADAYFKGVVFTLYEYSAKDRSDKKVLIQKKYEELLPEEKKQFDIYLSIIPKPHQRKSPTATQFQDYKDGKKYAIWLDGKNVPNSSLSKYKPEDIAYVIGSAVYKNARTSQHPQPYQFWLYTQKYFNTNKMDKVTKTHYDGNEIVMWQKTVKK